MRRRLIQLATILLLLSLSSLAQKQTPEPANEMTAADVEAFLDGFVPMQLQRENIAGAVVCVVKDGKVLFAQGYGYADVEKKRPVTPDATLFRPGSISKLFTWTAVMQLVEQGKLDLDRDINDYLDFRIPATYAQPITLRHIMTHTPGFEESLKQLFIPEDARIAPLSEYLPQHIPQRIFPPGATPAYSNYGATLAGYIVQRVSGKPFDEYVADNILKPLGMTRSTFSQPLNAELKPLMSAGYEQGSGKAQPFEVVQQAPAGSLSATASDLAHFMIAHLQDGRFENTQILRPETARQMHARQAGFHPEMNGMALGFYEESRNGHRIIGHGGDTIYFHSDLHLVLDAGVGFFVSYNSAGKGEISPRSALWDHFANRYFPYTPPEGARIVDAAADARSVAGYYMVSRRSESTLLKAPNSFGEAHVTAEPDGAIRITPLKEFNGEIRRWKEIAPLVYRAVNGQQKVAFQKQADGTLRLIIDFPAMVFDKVSGINTKPFNVLVVTFSMTVMCLALLLWPVAAGIRRHYGQRLDISPQKHGLRRFLMLVSTLDVAFALVAMAVLSSTGPITLISGRVDGWFRLLQLIALLGSLAALPAIYATFALLRERNLWFWSKLGNLLILLAALGFAWFAIHWNVLSWSLKY